MDLNDDTRAPSKVLPKLQDFTSMPRNIVDLTLGTKIVALTIVIVIFAILTIFLYIKIQAGYSDYFGEFLNGARPRDSKTAHEAMARWGQKGDYFGGIINPIIGLVSILILCATFIVQGIQLKLAKSMHELTQNALQAQLNLAKEEKDFNSQWNLVLSTKKCFRETYKLLHF